jgi:hypothetical protein
MRPAYTIYILLLLIGLVTLDAMASSITYTYDSLYRVTNVDYGNGSVISYTYDPAGNRLTYSGTVANDTTAPNISITTPTTGQTLTTSNAIINLSGTASDDTGVTLITWENISGGVGDAFGTNSWSVSGIHLQAGENDIFVTAYDVAGNSTEADLIVTYLSPDSIPPAIAITAPTSGQRWSNAVFTVTGTATDNVAVASVFCSLNNGVWTSAVGTINWTAAANLVAGTNTIQAYAVDINGNHSVTNSVNFIGVLSTVLTVRTNGLGAIAPNYNGQLLTIGQSYGMTATARSGFVFNNWTISTNWIGGSVTNNATVQFIMASNLTLLATFVDVTKPVLSITSPVAGQRWSNLVFTAKGTATDNWQVATVKYQLNGGIWTNATGTTNWSAPLTLTPGTNTIAAYATDTTGNSSTTNSVSFDYVVTNKLQVRAIGVGTISPNYSNSWLEIGRNYSITSSPASGFVATNWVVSTNWLGGVATNNKAVRFMMASNLTLQINFVDVTRPTNTITAPTSGQHMTNALATIVGTAKDNWKVTGVWYQLNNGPWKLAPTGNGWANWATTLQLITGTNTVKAYAMDLGGNFSTTNSLSVVSSDTFKLQLAFTNGQPMKPNGLGFSLQLSRGLNGHIQVSSNLMNWTTLTNFTGNNTTLNFRDPAATNSSRRFYRAVIP